MFGGVDAEGDYLRATLAGGFAFLDEPAAGGADAACGQGGFDCGHELDEAGGEAAVVAVEVGAGSLGAGGREAEDLCGWYRRRHGEELVCNGHRFFNPRDTGFFRILRIRCDYAKRSGPRHGGLRTGAEDRLL